MLVSRAVLLLIILTGSTYIQAQSLHEIYLQRNVSGQLLVSDSANHLYTSVNSYQGISVSKLDITGNILWQKQIGDSLKRYAALDMVLSSDHQLVICGFMDDGGYSTYRNGLLLFIDTAGNLKKKIVLGSIHDTYTCLNLIAEINEIIMTADYYSNTLSPLSLLKLLRFDNSGNKLLEKTLGGTYGYSYLLSRASNSTFILYSPTFKDMIRLDNYFHPLHCKTTVYDNSAYKIIKLIKSFSDSTYALCTEGFIGHVNSNLLIDHGYKFIFDTIHLSTINFLDGQQLEDSSWIFVGFNSDIPYWLSDYMLFHMTKNFEIVKTIYLNDGLMIDHNYNFTRTVLKNDILYFLASKSAGTIAQIGVNYHLYAVDSSLYNICQSKDTTVYMRRVSYLNEASCPCGTYPWSSTIDTLPLPYRNITVMHHSCLDTIATQLPEIKISGDLICFPNPVTDKLQIISNDRFCKAFSIYNLQGILQQSLFIGNQSTHEVIIHVNTLTTGFYILKADYEGISKYIRFVKQ